MGSPLSSLPRRQRRALAGLTATLVLALVAFAAVALTRDRDETALATDGDAATTTSVEVATTTTAAAGERPRASTTSAPPAPPGPAAAPTQPAPPTSAAGRPLAAGQPAPTDPPTTTTTAPPAPPFEGSVHPVTAEELGASWTPGLGCTPPEQLRRIHVFHWGYDGQVHQGDLIVHADWADRLVGVFAEIYAARFPIQQMRPVSHYGGDDGASMRANNTSAYNCRTVAGTSTLSQHALGLAVDVNPLVNPWVSGGSVDPPEGARYAWERTGAPGIITAGDPVVRAFGAIGWGWGGSWQSSKDYQHFSASGR